MALSLEPGVTIVVLDDLVRDLLDITLYLSIRKFAADETLCGEEGIFWVDNCLPLGGNANEALALFGETNNRRCRACACDGILAYRKYGKQGSWDVPSEFSMMRGVLPSITATAELVVPKSIPITEPLTFSLESSAYLRTNDERRGDVKAGTRWKAEAARGKNYDAVSVGPKSCNMCILTDRDILEDSMAASVQGVLASRKSCRRRVNAGWRRIGWW